MARKEKIKVVLEFPTFPYDNELKNRNIIRKSVLCIDILLRRFLKYFVHKAFTYTEHQEIFKIPSIKIDNGIDSFYYSQKKPASRLSPFELIGVACLAYWHGYDRVIKGLAEYYKTRGTEGIEVRFTIIGEGPAKRNLEELVSHYNIMDKVIFKGQLTGPDLDKEFDKAHIGVEVLGMHRRGFNQASSLKAKEYFIRGLPFVTSASDSDFVDSEFVLHIPADESPMNIRELIKFYHSLSGTDYSSSMNHFAKENFSWEKKLKPVLEFIN